MFKAVFQIFVKKTEPDFQNLWTPGKRSKCSGSGFGVEINKNKIMKKFIVTNSHVVRFSHYIEAVKHNSKQRFQLTLVDIANELDLALLEPIDSEFWNDVPILKIQEPPDKGSEILVVGFPQGGNNPSITKGIISRIIPVLYSKAIYNLTLQVDSAINPGNSGGPVFNTKEEIIGIAFSHNSKGQNICYVIPSFLLLHYLKLIERFDKFPGICDLEIECSDIENQSLKKFYETNNGIIVNRINPIGNLENLLEIEDIIISIDSIEINGDQTYFSNNSERFPYWHIIRMKFPGDLVELKIIRNKKEKIINFRINAMKQLLIPSINVDLSYYIAGGLIFIPLNLWYLFSSRDADTKSMDSNKINLYKYLREYPDTQNQQIIILIDILPNSQNSGYNIENLRLLRINDEEINNIKDVYKICENIIQTNANTNNKKIENQNNELINFIKFEFEMGKIIILSQETLLSSENISQTFLKASHTNVNI